MSRVVNKTGSQTYILNSYTGASNFGTPSNPSNAYKNCDNASSTSYSQASLSRNKTGSIYFIFNTSARTSIPSNATLTGISGRIYVRKSGNNTSNATVRPCSGTTQKGSALD